MKKIFSDTNNKHLSTILRNVNTNVCVSVDLLMLNTTEWAEHWTGAVSFKQYNYIFEPKVMV